MQPLQGEAVAHKGNDSEGKKEIPVHPVLCPVGVVVNQKFSKVSALVHIRRRVAIESTFEHLCLSRGCGSRLQSSLPSALLPTSGEGTPIIGRRRGDVLRRRQAALSTATLLPGKGGRHRH
jgi:hypothetical protein